MSKSYVVHLKNKYPDANVYESSSSIEVERAGVQLLKLQKNAHGGWDDVSEEYGLPEKFDLSPIPRDSRVHKLAKDGKICLDEKHEERKKKSKVILKKHGKIPSQVELKADVDYDFRNDLYAAKEELE